MIKFGDPEIIAEMYDKTPYLKEEQHRCDCSECTIDVMYKCSVCGRNDVDTDDFFVGDVMKCRSCGSILVWQAEHNRMVEQKRNLYIPIKEEQLIV